MLMLNEIIAETNASLVSQPQIINVMPIMTHIDVPYGHHAVIQDADGNIHWCSEGTNWLHRIANGPATVFYVDMRPQVFITPPILGQTPDGLIPQMRVAVGFKIESAIKILRLASPLHELSAAVCASARWAIETMPHDALVGMTNDPVQQRAILEQSILSRIRNRLNSVGFVIRYVDVLEIVADERWIEAMRQEHARKAALKLDIELAKMRQDYNLLAGQLKLIQAEIELKREKILAPLQDQKEQRENSRRQQELGHEVKMALIKGQLELLARLFEAQMLSHMTNPPQQPPSGGSNHYEKIIAEVLGHLRTFTDSHSKSAPTAGGEKADASTPQSWFASV